MKLTREQEQEVDKLAHMCKEMGMKFSPSVIHTFIEGTREDREFFDAVNERVNGYTERQIEEHFLGYGEESLFDGLSDTDKITFKETVSSWGEGERKRQIALLRDFIEGLRKAESLPEEPAEAYATLLPLLDELEDKGVASIIIVPLRGVVQKYIQVASS